MRRVWLAMVAASLGWGTTGVATRIALDEGVTPYRLASYRSVLAVVAVAAFLAFRRRGTPRGGIVWRVGVVMGLSNLAVPFILSNLALQYAGAGFLGLMTALIPLITAGIAHIALQDERLSFAKTIGLLIGLLGVAVLLLSGDSGLTEGGRPLIAGLLGLGAVTSVSAGTVYAKYFAGKYEPLDVAGVHFTSGMAIILVATLAVEGGPVSETAVAWGALAYLALLSTVMPLLLLYWMLRVVSVTYAALAGYLIPIVAVTAGVLVLDEQIQPGIVLGGAIIFIGLLVADRAERRPTSIPSAAD